MRRIALSGITPFLVRYVPVRGIARLLFRSYAKVSGSLGHNVTACVTRFGDRFETDLHSFVEWHVWAFGSYEHHLQELFGYLVAPGARCVDVGANFGLHSVRLAKLAGPTGRVIAVEADGELVQRATRNVELNGLTNVAVVHGAAMDGSRDNAMLYRPDPLTTNKGRGSLIHHPSLIGTPVTVPTVCLDDLIGEPVDLIKIDVEGGEGLVIAGAKRLISEYHPCIVFEHCAALTGEVAGPGAYLEGEGYQLYSVEVRRHRISGRARLIVVPLRGNPPYADVLAITPDRVHQLRELIPA